MGTRKSENNHVEFWNNGITAVDKTTQTVRVWVPSLSRSHFNGLTYVPRMFVYYGQICTRSVGFFPFLCIAIIAICVIYLERHYLSSRYIEEIVVDTWQGVVLQLSGSWRSNSSPLKTDMWRNIVRGLGFGRVVWLTMESKDGLMLTRYWTSHISFCLEEFRKDRKPLIMVSDVWTPKRLVFHLPFHELCHN